MRLEPLGWEHLDSMQAAADDGQLWNLRVTWVPSPEETRDYLQHLLDAQAQGLRLPFAVMEIASGRQLGVTSYHDILPAIHRLEIGGTWYRASVQRTHVNTACKLLMLQHAFDTLGCAVVGWRTDILNTRSQQAIERLGAQRDGVLRHHALRRDGSVRDTVMYSMLAAEWPAAQQRLLEKLKQHALAV